ncbi:MAG: stage II sporulation protein M [Candidatus Woesearchaeota archaeon]
MSIILPNFAPATIFNSQSSFVVSDSAKHIFISADPNSLFMNNLAVLVACFVTSLLFGIGTIFLFIVVWNASVVGVVFGVLSKETATAIGVPPLFIFIIVLAASLPHIIFEISAYLLSGILGEHISDSMLHKIHIKAPLNFFFLSMIAAVLLLFLAALLETVFPNFFIGLVL